MKFEVTIVIPTDYDEHGLWQQIAHQALVSLAREYVENGANIQTLIDEGVVTIRVKQTDVANKPLWEQTALWGDPVPYGTQDPSKPSPLCTPAGELRAFRTPDKTTPLGPNLPQGTVAYDSNGDVIVMTSAGWIPHAQSFAVRPNDLFAPYPGGKP